MIKPLVPYITTVVLGSIDCIRGYARRRSDRHLNSSGFSAWLGL